MKNPMILAPDGSLAARRSDIRAYYEAARSSPARSNINGVVQGANRDADAMTRRELIRASRTLYKNSPYFRGLVERAVTLAIGCGIQSCPASSSERYNETSESALKAWGKRPAVGTPFMWRQLQRIILRAMILDGEVFVYLFRKNGAPRIRLIESHCIGYGISRIYSGEADGVVMDADGDPVAYEYYPDEYNRKPVILPAQSVVHFMWPERAEMARSVGLLASIITTGHDIHDIIAMEKAAVKSVSKNTDIIKTASGELDVEDLHADDGRAVEVSDADGSKYYERVFGPEAKILRNGDEYAGYEPKRPGPAWQGFMDFLSQLCCIGFNLPPSILLPLRNQGADTRKDLGIAERVIEGWQGDIQPGLEEIINWAQWEHIQTRRVSNAPSDWSELSWQYPKRLSVDYGRDSKSDREDVKMGMLSLREYYGREGMAWKEELEQIATEQAYVKQLAEANGLTQSDLMMKNPNQPMDQQAQADGQDAASEPAKSDPQAQE